MLATTRQKQTLVGLGVLACGVFVYLADRPPWHIPLIPTALSVFDGEARLPDWLGGSLPTFTHVFAFSLITGGRLATSRFNYRMVCCFWGFVDLSFEIGQAPLIYEYLAPYLGSGVGGLGHALNAYFQNGVYDPADVVSILLGAVAAYWTLLALNPTGGDP